MKQKRFTQKEKQLRAECKKKMQEEGVLPPDKKPLNRKKFAREVLDEFDETMTGYADSLYLHRAIGMMVSAETHQKITSEQVGVLKMLKLAMETKKFMETLHAEGRDTYNLAEFCDKVAFPILNL